jgi:hypothetical protein
MKYIIFSYLSLIAGLYLQAQTPDNIRIKYNNPDLPVDLGTGLWGAPIPVDYDGDGLTDILMSCPDTPFKGVYYFKNTGTKSDPLFDAPVKLSGKAFLNLQASYAEGKLHVFTPGCVYDDFAGSLFSKPRKIVPDVLPGHDFANKRSNIWSYVDYDSDGDLDILVGIDDWADYGWDWYNYKWDSLYDEKGEWKNGPARGYLYLLENRDGKYVNRGKIQAGGKDLETFGAPGSNMADWDGDGRKDIIAGEFLDRLTWYRNAGTGKSPEFEAGRYLENEKGEVIRMYLEMITPVAFDFDGDGLMDLLVGDEDGRVAFLKNTGKKRKSAPVFKDPAYLKQKAGYLKFGALSTPFSVDWDGDGYPDIISGNSAGNIGFIKNLDGSASPKWAAPVLLQAGGKDIRIMAGKNGSVQGPAEEKWGYTTLSVADWDRDGRADIIVNSIWGKIIWYRNTGDLRQLEGPYSVKVDWGATAPPKPEWNWWDPGKFDLVTQWRTTPVAIDWNRDGLTDLIVLDQEGYLSYYERFEKDGELWLKPGVRIFMAMDMSRYDHDGNQPLVSGSPLQLNTGMAGKSGRRKICFVDWDNDGDKDLIVNGHNAVWFENRKEENGYVYFVNRGKVSSVILAGHDTAPTPVDWDNDGIYDLLVGAEDGHFYLIQNRNKTVNE